MFDPAAADFTDPPAVDREMRRVADICHTCRRCYNLCPSFDVLFRALDRGEVDGEADRLEAKDLGLFSDLCYECKLCIPHCPYYPPHRWEVDIPRLVFRDRAARVKSDGKPALRERILASADAVGALSTKMASVANALNETRLIRFLLDKTLGVHHDRLLPSWAPEPFIAWWRRRGGAVGLLSRRASDPAGHRTHSQISDPDRGGGLRPFRRDRRVVKPISFDEILNLHEYEIARPDFRAKVIGRKKRRRVALGPLMTLLFENRDTVLFQVQEMLRIERIVQPQKVQDELDVYNELLPDDGEVAATMFIEVTDPAQVQPTLDRMVGLDEPGKVRLKSANLVFPACFAAGQSREDRISAVHYIRFPLGDEGRTALKHTGGAEIEVDHGGYEARVALPPETVEELREDLGG